MKTVRCAIYTRKSSDEGLEQDFNSLDAQREACAAYVLSQASEGWKLLPEQYDDGGLSGGTLERPGLQRLLAEVKTGKVDIIVVYKVDRLTRSLLDFSRLVETFDASGTSFVSVTQSFNTTTSMGRLTLNMLLSFAQFEREVTAERIRDKIAASKAKGMWMGGLPPLGYQPEGRSLAIIAEHAALVRDIFSRYRSLCNVRLVAEALMGQGITTPPRLTQSGRAYGGCAFTRGQLYAILRNPIYAGDIPHKGKIFPGNHAAIIDRTTWNAVQQQLDSNIRGVRQTHERNASLLAGFLVDASGEPLIQVHTSKPVAHAPSGKVRYRYYVSKALQHGTGSPSSSAVRLPAREIEQVVRQELAALFCDPWQLIHKCSFEVGTGMLAAITKRCSEAQAKLAKADRALLGTVLTRVALGSDQLTFSLSRSGIAELLGVSTMSPNDQPVIYEAPVRLTRTGRAMRLVQMDGGPALGPTPDASLIRLIVQARRWWRELSRGEINVTTLAAREKVTSSYVARVIRLAFLAPAVVDAILIGETRPHTNRASLLRTGAIAADWDEQAKQFLPAQHA